ncbi:translational activator for mitochondrial COX1 [Pleurotus pulmonarius]|nr:translational activator for mitochondrial COX1 [Pleurotus pulmonarius]KAF4608961.1 translational activator for mitochondrial COX1 [Pleurotus pulmonarius]
MSFSRRLLHARSPTRLIATPRPRICVPRHAHSCQDHLAARPIFSFFRRSKKNDGATGKASEPVPVLTEDNLFHPFSKSPFPPVRARGEAIQSLAPCPVCSSHDHAHPHAHIEAQPKTATFECPDCGWPTHCSEEHWAEDDEHHEKYCTRLREANEDEHDLRSGRRFREFELPGEPVALELMDYLLSGLYR